MALQGGRPGAGQVQQAYPISEGKLAMSTQIDLNDPRLTRQEVHLLRTILGRVA
jgi:hypothetical protein